MSAAYRRCHHAAHTGPGRQGWDLEQWTVAQAWAAPRPADVPADAEKHSGFVEDGVQHVVFTRRAPLGAGPCTRCDAEGARA